MLRTELVATRVVAWAGACLIVCGTVACKDEKRSELPDWSNGYEQGGPMVGPGASDGGVADAGGDGGVPDENPPPTETFAIRRAKNVVWPMKIRNQKVLQGGRTEPCYVEQDSLANELTYNTAKNIRCVIDMDELDLHQLGVQFDVVVPEGMCDFLVRVPYIYENFEVGLGPANVSYTVAEDGTFSDEVNSMGGAPYCRYDYTQFGPQFPNCCYGGYTVTVTSLMTGKTSVSRGRWGAGKLGDCYYGGGYLDAIARFDTQGFPIVQTIYLGRKGFVQEEYFNGIEGKYASNVALANHYDPTEHADMPPAALRVQRAQPDYDYYCVDDAEETIAHIAIEVREWNEEVEFDADGDPDTVGTETGWESPIDDWTDWKTLTPGPTDFPQLPHL